MLDVWAIYETQTTPMFRMSCFFEIATNLSTDIDMCDYECGCETLHEKTHSVNQDATVLDCNLFLKQFVNCLIMGRGRISSCRLCLMDKVANWRIAVRATF